MEDNIKLNINCSCKGIRTCMICEKIKSIQSDKLEIINLNYRVDEESSESFKNITHYYIPINDEYDIDKYINARKIELNRKGNYIFSGFYKISGLFDLSEQTYLIDELNKSEWLPSQSGRKKQDYGPKINYKKKKIKHSNEPFPDYKNFIQNRLNTIEFLKDFAIDEIGNLYYEASMGAHIDPHIDHYWIWGDRIVGINLLSETFITFSIEHDNFSYEIDLPIGTGDVYVMTEESRYIWKHSVKKENVNKDRIVMTMREFIK
jgi:alkylated DNA repair protein alkB family protein 4